MGINLPDLPDTESKTPTVTSGVPWWIEQKDLHKVVLMHIIRKKL